MRTVVSSEELDHCEGQVGDLFVPLGLRLELGYGSGKEVTFSSRQPSPVATTASTKALHSETPATACRALRLVLATWTTCWRMVVWVAEWEMWGIILTRSINPFGSTTRGGFVEALEEPFRPLSFALSCRGNG